MLFSTQSLVLATLFLAQAQAHSYMVKPKGRLSFKNGLSDTFADGSGNYDGLCHLGDGSATCCNTAQMSSAQRTTYKRGDEVETTYWRNNHVGGFVRYSIVPIDKSDSQDAFDATENVVNYHCAQVGCDKTYGGDSPNNWNGGDSQGSQGWSNQCTGSFKIPYWMEDGIYTLQMVWYGQGNAPSANSPFQTCVDLEISGGSTGTQPKCPLWRGGDLSEKAEDACVFVSVNNPTYQGTCASANACQGSYTVGLPKAIDDCQKGKLGDSQPLFMVANESGSPDTYTSYKASGGSNSSSSSTSSKKKSSSKSKPKTGSNAQQGDGESSGSSKCSSLRRRSTKSKRNPQPFRHRRAIVGNAKH